MKRLREEMRLMALVLLAVTLSLEVSGCLSCESAGGIGIASSGKPLLDIVVAGDATPSEALARKELEEHLEKVVGAKFNVVKEDDFKHPLPSEEDSTSIKALRMQFPPPYLSI